jgi:hypothetical protein
MSLWKPIVARNQTHVHAWKYYKLNKIFKGKNEYTIVSFLSLESTAEQPT